MVIVAFLAAALAGYAGARLGSGRPDTANSPALSKRMATRGFGRAGHWQMEDFSKWPMANGSLDSLRDEWGDWSDEELRTALETGVKDPRSVIREGVQQQVIVAMFGEWVRRHPDEARVWFEGLTSETMRQSIAWAFAENWPKERAEEGLAYVIAHRDWFDTDLRSASRPLIKGAIETVAKRGVVATDDLLRLLRENQLGNLNIPGCAFPEGFDFAKLMESPETKRLTEGGSVFFAAEWTKHNPEEAFQYLVAEADVRRIPLDQMFEDIRSREVGVNVQAASQRAKWLAGKLAELPEESQREVASSAIRSLLNPQVIGNFVAALPNGPLRTEMTSSATISIFSYGPESTLAYLEAAGDLEWRLGILEAVESTYPNWSMTKGAESLLRAKLAGWQVPPERAEAIVARYQKLTK